MKFSHIKRQTFKTSHLKHSHLKNDFIVVFDCNGWIYGKLVTFLAELVRNSMTFYFSKHLQFNNKIFVLNVDKIMFSNNKKKKIFMFRHGKKLGNKRFLHWNNTDFRQHFMLSRSISCQLPNNKSKYASLSNINMLKKAFVDRELLQLIDQHKFTLSDVKESSFSWCLLKRFNRQIQLIDSSNCNKFFHKQQYSNSLHLLRYN